MTLLPAYISTGLTITNPLILYRALLATKRIDPDPAQHRLALHLQKLYFRLKDYSPQAEYISRLNAIKKAVDYDLQQGDDDRAIAVRGHPLRKNPLFDRIFGRGHGRDTRALTRVLTSHEAAMGLDSPRGLLLHGEVGTGKSMLVDLLAGSLPNQKKRRWHFDTFMLETISRLESLRSSRLSKNASEAEYSLLWLAKDMMETSPILFLDEFQLPDRASSKLISNLLTVFFQLGGVLIASSNRMPEELAKASGVEFVQPPRGQTRNLLGSSRTMFGKGNQFAGDSEFADFLDVLKARCDVWDMEGSRDWRRREAQEDNSPTEILGLEETRDDTIQSSVADNTDASILSILNGQNEQTLSASLLESGEDMGKLPSSINGVTPSKYLLASKNMEGTWQAMITASFSRRSTLQVPWEPAKLIIYGRTVIVPRQHDGVALWSFEMLCGGPLGPADFITMASTFHTFIIDDVPILTLQRKNEARRLITLLDALYEAKCKLIIRAEAGPDDLFFPEASRRHFSVIESNSHSNNENDSGDAVYPETFSEIYQDQVSPFRPNVSLYDSNQDSDFGISSQNQGRLGTNQVDFGKTTAFTGEDERFAYKRARSRLWEMCGSRWHARSEPGWWRPLPLDIRRWEGSIETRKEKREAKQQATDEDLLESSTDFEEPARLYKKEFEAEEQGLLEERVNPFKKQLGEPPRFGWPHAWGMAKWGEKAGSWGKGPDDLSHRNRKRNNKDSKR